MNSDATEAALGLLGLSPRNLEPQLPAPLVPLKRKQPGSASIHPASSQENRYSENVQSSEAINCICGFTYDDGFSIACDDCSRWCHAACFDIVEGQDPEEWRCWVCMPRPVDKEKAVKLQKARQKRAQETPRKVSPGVDKKGRNRSTSNPVDGNKKKRRASINNSTQQQQQSHNNQHQHQQSQSQQHAPPQSTEDEHVDIDEPWTQTYVPITKDIIPHQETRDKLRRQARQWRGVTALQSSFSSPQDMSPVPLPEHAIPSPTLIHPIPMSSLSNQVLSPNTNPAVRPPTYAMHTTAPVPFSHFITPYTSTITPSSAYLADPLNSYAHLGMPKPFVHLMGPPLDVALDSRLAGDESRFVRSGCRPNAVLRPVICPTDKKKGKETTLTFGVFAMRDLKENEEVVLGWEWDDGNVVHNLPALIESPHMFPPAQLEQLRHQMSGILHALSSTFTTCACGSSSKDCALAQMAAFVDGEVHQSSEHARVDLGPLVGVERGFRTREKIPFSGGMSGVEMDMPSLPSSSAHPAQGRRRSVQDVATAFRATNASQGESSKSAIQQSKQAPSSQLMRPPKSLVQVKDRKGKGRAIGERPQEAKSSLSGGSAQTPKAFDDTGDYSSRSSTGHAKAGEGRANGKTISHPHRSRFSMDERISRREEEEEEEEEEEPEQVEIKMPIKMRKRWMHQARDFHNDVAMSPAISTASLGSVASTTGIEDSGRASASMGHDVSKDAAGMDVDEGPPDSQRMPPPPLPAFFHPTTVSTVPPPSHDSTASPSTSFANLSLLSPLFSGPQPNPIHHPLVSRQSVKSPTPESADTSSPRTMLSAIPLPEKPPVVHPVINTDSILTTPSPSSLTLPSSAVLQEQTQPEVPATNGSESQRDHAPLLNGLHPPLPRQDSALHRVRFASPERLGSFSPLRRLSNENSALFTEEQYDQKIESSLHVDSEVLGGLVSLSETVCHEVTVEEQASSVAAPSPSTPQSPPRNGHLPRRDAAVEDTSVCQNDPVVQVQPASPATQPKVKLSLKDFALRKRKQREEEMALAASPSAAVQPAESKLSVASSILVGQVCAVDGMVKTEEFKNEDSVVDQQKEQDVRRPAGDNHVALGRHSPITGYAEFEKIPLESPGHEGTMNGQGIHTQFQMATPQSPSPRMSSLRRTPEFSMLPQPIFNTLQGKVEAIEHVVPNGLVATRESYSDSPDLRSHSPVPRLNGDITQISLPTPPLDTDFRNPRRSLQEDGEIVASPPKYSSYVPRSRTPPTQPRSFPYLSASPNIGTTPSPSMQPRRPPPHTSIRGVSSPATVNPRPLPSGPRALRGGNIPGSSPAPYPPSRGPYGGSPYIPRGPSADRDRLDWERERSWNGPPRGRGRGGNNWR